MKSHHKLIIALLASGWFVLAYLICYHPMQNNEPQLRSETKVK